MRRLIPYLILSVVFITSCNKHLKTEANNDPQGYGDSQVVGTWKITAVISDISWDWDNNGSPETNIYNTWAACLKDNLYTFIGDKTGTFKLNCSATYPGSWYIANTQFLVYTPSMQVTEFEKLISMTVFEFKTSIAVTLSNGQPANITKTWTRQ